VVFTPGGTPRIYGRRGRLPPRQEGKIHFDGAHFRRDIAAKAMG
jgi:hypothetical protein